MVTGPRAVGVANAELQGGATVRNLADNLRATCALHPDRTAIVCSDRTLSYSELDAETSRVANALIASGVGPQDRVCILAKNGAEFATVTYGAAKAGAVSVGVNWRLAAPEIDFIVYDAEAKVLVIEEEFLGHLDQMKLERDPLIVTVGTSPDHLSYPNWIEGVPATDPNAAVTNEGTALQVYTSGTTGLPKGAELSNENLESAFAALAVCTRMDAETVALMPLPLFHIGGAAALHVSIMFGAKLVVHRDFDPARILTDIPDQGVTTVMAVPAMLLALTSVPGVSDVDLSSVDLVMYGASPISEQVLVASMDIFDCDFGQFYGLTETAGAITYLDPEDHDPGGPRAHLLRSAGRAVLGAEIRIVDDDGQAKSDGDVGEIWVRAGHTLSSYWKNPDATAAAYPAGRDPDVGGWFATGDAGYLQDGYLFIFDRVNDMIVSGAENIYPAEVENAIMAHPGVADVAVIGVPSEQWGESPMALILPAPGCEPTAEDITEFCANRIASFKIPKAVEIVAEIPRNPSGKILKSELRKPYWQGLERAVN